MEAQSEAQLNNRPGEISRSLKCLLSPAGPSLISFAVELGLWAEKFPMEALRGEPLMGYIYKGGLKPFHSFKQP